MNAFGLLVQNGVPVTESIFSDLELDVWTSPTTQGIAEILRLQKEPGRFWWARYIVILLVDEDEVHVVMPEVIAAKAVAQTFYE